VSTRLLACIALGLIASGCGGGDKPSGGRDTTAAAGASESTGGGAALTGAGATFPNPIYTKWFDAYAKRTGVRINYQSIGSGGGIRQFTEGTVDFGATDGPMKDDQIKGVNGNVLHVPTVLGAVVVTYNLPEVAGTPLRFDGATLADIFLGRITKWNDSRLAALNPGAKLPAKDIIVVHRSDGSGTSFIFTDYLSKVSPSWKEKVGSATSVEWPIGLGGKGNEGVTQQVKQSDGAVGYVELIYAISNELPYGDIKNASGEFIRPSLKSVSAAAAEKFPEDTDFRVSITNAKPADAYPISSFTWLLIQPQPRDPAKGEQLRKFIGWMLQPEAQRMAADLHYAPLPVPVIELVQQRLAAR
jgi:phosphate transport system substrate-binding protein